MTTCHRRETESLPPPVRRYFDAALQDGQAIVTGMRFTQEGQCRQHERTSHGN